MQEFPLTQPPPWGSSIRLSHVVVKKRQRFLLLLRVSPKSCCLLCCLHSSVSRRAGSQIPSGWHIAPGSWDGRGHPHSEQSLGTFPPLWDAILSCIFTVLCSRAVQVNELKLEVTNSPSSPKVPVMLHPRCSSCSSGSRKEPREGSCWYLQRALSVLCLPGLEVVTSYLIIIPNRLFLLDHLQLLHGSRRCCSCTAEHTPGPSQEYVNTKLSRDHKQLV